jgi:type IV pilus assembly protein PilO
MRFGPREYLLLGILLALPVSSYWLVFRPQNAEISQAKREILHKRQMLEKSRETTAMNVDLKRENDEIAAKISAMEAQLPTNKEVDSIVRQVSELAVAAGLDPPLMTSDKPVAAALYMEQPLKMSLTGDFQRFYDFLLRLETLPRKTRIPDMKIKRSDKVEGHMRADFTLSIYFLPEAAKP